MDIPVWLPMMGLGVILVAVGCHIVMAVSWWRHRITSPKPPNFTQLGIAPSPAHETFGGFRIIPLNEVDDTSDACWPSPLWQRLRVPRH